MNMRLRKPAIAACLAAYTAALSVTFIIKKRNANRRTYERTHTAAHHTRKGLIHPKTTKQLTIWQKVLQHGCDSDFIVTTNFTRSIYTQELLPLFVKARLTTTSGSPYRRTQSKRGRKALLSSVDLLALALAYLKTGDKAYQLCPFFGIVPSTLSVWLDYSLFVLLKATKLPEANKFYVRWPIVEEQKSSAYLLRNNRKFGPLLEGVFGITDGGRFRCQNYGDPNLQNAFFEGYTQQEEVTNLFVFNFYGEIIHAAINYPGTWHDTRLASVSGLYHKQLSDERTPPGMAILGDSAFVNNTRCTNGKIVRARKTNETSDIPQSEQLAAIDLILQRILPSERQSAEWGIRALKGPSNRLSATLTSDAIRRGILLELCVRLFNFRTRTLGRNRIVSTYNPSE